MICSALYVVYFIHKLYREMQNKNGKSSFNSLSALNSCFHPKSAFCKLINLQLLYIYQDSKAGVTQKILIILKQILCRNLFYYSKWNGSLKNNIANQGNLLFYLMQIKIRVVFLRAIYADCLCGVCNTPLQEIFRMYYWQKYPLTSSKIICVQHNVKPILQGLLHKPDLIQI